MNEPLAEAYFHWLVDQVREDDEHHTRTYWDLLRTMHDTEFVWIVPNDDNRVMDGLDLRREFILDREGDDARQVIIDKLRPCSALEVTIALSRRLAFLDGGKAEGWAWQLLDNLGLTKYWDPLSHRKTKQVQEILYALVWRTYQPDGTGGFFPLAWPEKDQRKVEIWYQMSAYFGEIHPEY